MSKEMENADNLGKASASAAKECAEKTSLAAPMSFDEAMKRVEEKSRKEQLARPFRIFRQVREGLTENLQKELRLTPPEMIPDEGYLKFQLVIGGDFQSMLENFPEDLFDKLFWDLTFDPWLSRIQESLIVHLNQNTPLGELLEGFENNGVNVSFVQPTPFEKSSWKSFKGLWEETCDLGILEWNLLAEAEKDNQDFGNGNRQLMEELNKVFNGEETLEQLIAQESKLPENYHYYLRYLHRVRNQAPSKRMGFMRDLDFLDPFYFGPKMVLVEAP